MEFFLSTIGPFVIVFLSLWLSATGIVLLRLCRSSRDPQTQRRDIKLCFAVCGSGFFFVAFHSLVHSGQGADEEMQSEITFPQQPVAQGENLFGFEAESKLEYVRGVRQLRSQFVEETQEPRVVASLRLVIVRSTGRR